MFIKAFQKYSFFFKSVALVTKKIGGILDYFFFTDGIFIPPCTLSCKLKKNLQKFFKLLFIKSHKVSR